MKLTRLTFGHGRLGQILVGADLVEFDIILARVDLAKFEEF